MPDDVTPIDLRMAESLRELDRVLESSDATVDLNALARHLETGGKLKSEAYGAYFALVRALQDDPFSPPTRLVTVLGASALPRNASIAVRMLGFEEFGRAGTKSTRTDFASESLHPIQMGPIPPAAHVRMRRRLEDALDLIKMRAPNAWSDVSRITTEIVATYGVSRGVMTFDGCSSLQRYGSILVNMRRRRTPLVLSETLVHESAHSLLFALSCNDHRVLNPASERYQSPLRIDPRPLDGIYHAVFVLARMHGFVAEVAQHPETTGAMRREAKKVMSERKKNFLDGYAVLIEHAKLTDIGRDLLEDAFDRVEQSSRKIAA